ncbi:hypothetical protein CMEL01_15654 [Colletotrichum melonis]|uniref:Zinc-binding loop region of homing endonuclease domain-containing protein n=1 Tax=Colletotrichum melonis TaxID=1209925 RepID=A0AAI9XS71_9PEZI|nr:hypothetical protein CMEL01_15654 [Colletotrichum melonis]
MARARINIMDDLGWVRAKSLIAKRRAKRCEVDTKLGCHVPIGCRTRDGYAQVSFPEIWTKSNAKAKKGLTGRKASRAYLLHIVAYAQLHKRNPNDHVSHLCDNPACFNPTHLVDETASNNNSRKGCPGPIYCSDHGCLIVNLCNHNPPCIRPPRQDVQCCLSHKEFQP